MPGVLTLGFAMHLVTCIVLFDYYMLGVLSLRIFCYLYIFIPDGAWKNVPNSNDHGSKNENMVYSAS